MDGQRGAVLPRVAVVACLAGAFIILALLVFGGGNGDHQYRFVFENAGQLVPDNQVQIGGHPAGSVEDIDLTDDGLAIIKVSVDQQLHEGTTAVIRATSLAGVANRYISISPGPNSSPEIDDDATIGQESTASPVDLDQVFNAFTPRTRKGLSDFIKGQAGIYANKGEKANRTYKYFEPALSATNRVLAQVNADQALFKQFITGSAEVFTALAGRRDDLSASVSNANQAFQAITSENQALDESLQRLPGTFRQSNTAFVNLRSALDDLDSLVNTAKPATKNLTSFLKKARPVVVDSVPFFRDFRLTMQAPGPDNDLAELTGLLPRVERKAAKNFKRGRRALHDFQPVIEFARPYAPEMVNGLAKLGQVMGYYDANGHYARTMVSGLNILEPDAGGNLVATDMDAQYDPYAAPMDPRRCPGGAAQPAADNSNPFAQPPWPLSGLQGGSNPATSECDPNQVPPGP